MVIVNVIVCLVFNFGLLNIIVDVKVVFVCCVEFNCVVCELDGLLDCELVDLGIVCLMIVEIVCEYVV